MTFADFADRRFGITSGSSVQAVFVIGALIHLGQMSGAPSGFCKRFGFASVSPSKRSYKSIPALVYPVTTAETSAADLKFLDRLLHAR
ncbi:MAG: hypothetical protein ACLP19_10810 [Xanthobacteraceae bacterium]